MSIQDSTSGIPAEMEPEHHAEIGPDRDPESQPEIVLVVSVTDNGVIGRDGQLVFHDPADMKRFRGATSGCPVIMGRKTWDSLPPDKRPLPKRRNVVVSRNPALHLPGAERAASLDEALALVRPAPRVCVIGGSGLFAQALPLARTLVMTEVHTEVAGDTFFPPWPRELFAATERSSHRSAEGVEFDFVTYRRR